MRSGNGREWLEGGEAELLAARRAASAGSRSAQPSPGDQRDRRRAAHRPGPLGARAARPWRRWRPPAASIRCWRSTGRRASAARGRSTSGTCCAGSPGAEDGAGRQQQCRGGAPRDRRAGGRAGGRHRPRAARGDRRLVPHPGRDPRRAARGWSKSARPTRCASRTTQAAITSETALLLRVHPSNFQIVGFTEEVPLPELAAAGTGARRAGDGRPGQRRADRPDARMAWKPSRRCRRAWRPART